MERTRAIASCGTVPMTISAQRLKARRVPGPNEDLLDATRHLVAYSWTSGVSSVYVDGEFDQRSTTNPGDMSNSAHLHIGAKGTGWNPWTGHMDEVRISRPRHRRDQTVLPDPEERRVRHGGGVRRFFGQCLGARYPGPCPPIHLLSHGPDIREVHRYPSQRHPGYPVGRYRHCRRLLGGGLDRKSVV